MHAATMQIGKDTTLNQIIDQLNIPHELAHIVLVNGFFKCGEERNRPTLKAGDKVAIWPPVAGG